MLPESADLNSVSLNVKDGKVVVSYNDRYVPKFGDIVRVNCPGGRYLIAIMPDKHLEGDYDDDFFDIASLNFIGDLIMKNEKCGLKRGDNIVPASEEEKNRLFDKMKEAGYRWNAETKKVERIRWRAKMLGGYFFIGSRFCIDMDIDCNTTMSNARWESGNYFRTKEAAEAARDKILAILKDSPAE